MSKKHWNKRMNEIKKIVHEKFDELEEFLEIETWEYKKKYLYDHLELCKDLIIEDIEKLSGVSG